MVDTVLIAPSAPPVTRGLRSWWKRFRTGLSARVSRPFIPLFTRPADPDRSASGDVFGTRLHDSLRVASVQIATANQEGELFVWGYVPVVVAKCGLYLKENCKHPMMLVGRAVTSTLATETPGIFESSRASARAVDELQAIFSAGPRFGKDLDWKATAFTPFDVAGVFLRYLNRLPEPLIPYDLYADFRTLGVPQASTSDAITEARRMVKLLPRINQYALLYVLDLLGVFARKADMNLLTPERTPISISSR
ncbi:hypothetical protein FRB99_000268 [Tulasnella sp. 403]|nr:hypothetical protein FRB99_000268 [Tulasnella sp. 403]